MPRSRLRSKLQPERRSLGVTGDVFGRIADGDQGLLEHSAMRVVDGKASRTQPLTQIIAHPALPRQLFEKRLILGAQPELALHSLETNPCHNG